MKRLLGLLMLGSLLGLVASLSAEEPHIEFIRALRARQYNDLAMEYLQKISKNPSPELARELPLEWARVRMDLARQEMDLGRRLTLYAEARKDLEESIKKNPAQESEARLEIAQVTVLQAKAQFARAERSENREARKGEMARARDMLVEAAKLMEVASGRINAQLEKLSSAKTAKELAEKRSLELAKVRAEYERGLNLFDQAMTHVGGGQERTITELVTQAQKVLSNVADMDLKNPLCWQAAAWVGRCYHESGDPRKARTRFENIMAEASPAAEPGRRLAAHFRMLVLPEAVVGKENPVEMQRQAGEQWRKNFPQHLNTLEGLAVTFRLADIYQQLAVAAKDAKDTKNMTLYYETAKRLYQQLEQTDNDYTDRARDRKLRIIFTAQGGPTGDVAKFQTFEDCFVRAQYEVFKITSEDPKEIKDLKELEKKRKERYTAIIAALQRGLKIAESSKTVKTPERDVLTAASLLAYTYMSAEDYANAAKAAESIVFTNPKSTQASTAAIYALQSYTQLVADPAKGEDYREPMKKLVAFIKERWPDEPVADYARHEVGLQLIREKKLIEGMDELSQIRPAYERIFLVKWQLVAAAQQAEQDMLKPTGKDQRPFKEQALAALQSMPELPPNADPSMSHIYISAKIQIGQHLYEQKKFKEMEVMVQPLLDRLPKMRFEDDQLRDQLKTGLSSLTLYARYGQAEADYSAGKYADVAKVLDPVVKMAKGGKLPELKSIPQLRFAILGLAIRANVLDNRMKEAQEALQALQDYSDAKEGGAKNEAVLQPIIKTMSDQIEQLRRKGPKAQLDKTIKSFSDFLDLLRKEQKNPSPIFLFVMGQSYMGLGRYADAVAALEQVKINDADEKMQQIQRAAQLMLLRALRQSGQLDKAEAAHKAVMAEPWGKQNLEALKEEGHLLEARDKFGLGAQHWNGLLKTLQGRIQTDPNAKEQYFEIYSYLVRSYYRFGQSQTDTAKKEKYIKAAGAFIQKLEVAWPDLGGEVGKARFFDLMEKEPALKKAYEQSKAENK